MSQQTQSNLEPLTANRVGCCAETAWKMLVELRREVLESQRIRSQIIGFKISFVATTLAVLLTLQDRIPPALLLLPCFAAVFFDLLILSYGFSIKRIAYYCRVHLEPEVVRGADFPKDFLAWEMFLARHKAGQNFSTAGDVGITLLAAVPAFVIMLRSPTSRVLSVMLLAVFLLLLACDLYGFVFVGRISRVGFKPVKP